jgi:hypothetical protein
MGNSYLWSETAYDTKVMLGSINKLVCDALQEIAPDESTTVEAYEKATTAFLVGVVAFSYASTVVLSSGAISCRASQTSLLIDPNITFVS